ncbi:ABC transporter permease [Shinella sp. AETb1-6]|jgi:ribose transport system permease protein|uniref:ABC transporter permease n=1 Tax=Shinella oryzae TaxID=2871820 RepID=A0ABY9KDK0_9HYPH|nr:MULTISPECIES: ABC transporter permease [Shinella]MDP9587777.1 ribose transport system permease protein [Shinella zoogloeoides]WLS10948.1 ABC transporter permease [Shinella sumterensis]MXN51748.1 ABC transporter permease [Shinella sp. AETb1-6]UPA26443.1 ABC transporter permease [Shinella oryzae]WLS05701.1 ABC transporter permease [Shinella oryzae]
MTDTVTGVAPARTSGRRVADLLIEYNFIAIFLVVVAIAAILSPNFLTSTNIANLFQQAAVVGVVAVGMTFVILTGNIDLSVGSVVALCGMLVAVLLAGGMPIVPALAITILTGALAGAVIGLITALAEVPSFIVSLAGLVSFRGITYLLTDGVPVSGLPPSFGAISSTMVPVLPGLQVSSMGLIFVVLCIAAGALLRLTVFGESVYATGGNAEAARLSGLPTTRILVLVFTVSGVMSALAGILLTSRLRIGQPTAAQGLELDAIAAVVLGGTSLFGGRGGVLGTFFAVMLLQVLRNIFNLLGLGSFYQMTVTGLIIVAAILLNRFIDIRRGRA